MKQVSLAFLLFLCFFSLHSFSQCNNDLLLNVGAQPDVGPAGGNACRNLPSPATGSYSWSVNDTECYETVEVSVTISKRTGTLEGPSGAANRHDDVFVDINGNITQIEGDQLDASPTIVVTEILNNPASVNIDVDIIIRNGNGGDCFERVGVDAVTVTGTDTAPPVFDSQPAAIADISCGDPLPTQETLTASDVGCGENAPVSPTIIDFTPDSCNDVDVTYRWVAADACGNITIIDRTFTILADTQAPVITVDSSNDPAGACNPSIIAPTFTGTDNCEGAIIPVVSTDGATNTGCNYTQTWTANYTDACSNAATPVSVTYTWIEDTQAPVITVDSSNDPAGACNPSITPPTFTGTDNCEGAIIPVVSTTGATNTGCNYTQTWTANYTDGCSNAATPVSVTYTWIEDTQAPVITVDSSNDPAGACNPSIIAPTFTGTDNCEGAIIPVVSTTGATNTGCNYTQTWTANYTDGCSNAATPVSVTYTWIEDTQHPQGLHLQI